MEACKTCHARIIFAETLKGRRMPVDSAPDKGGNVMLVQRKQMMPLAIVLTKDDLTVHNMLQTVMVEGLYLLRPTDALYKSHFATCQQAKNWKKGKSR